MLLLACRCCGPPHVLPAIRQQHPHAGTAPHLLAAALAARAPPCQPHKTPCSWCTPSGLRRRAAADGHDGFRTRIGPSREQEHGWPGGRMQAAGAKPNPWLGLTHDEARAVQHCPHPAATAAAALDQLLRVEAGWGDLRAGRHRRSGKRAAWAAAAARRRRRRRGLASAGGCLWCRREWVRSPSLLAGRRRSARRLCWCPEAGDAPGGGCAHCCRLHELSVSDTSEWRKGGRARDASSHASAHAAPSARGGSAALASPTGQAAAAHSAPALAAPFI